ncbi:MAG: DUF3883 domain-containing protein, partial [Sphingomonadales bacterium]|nr:DUF3883 domain-containing protein [Sphingomonadales bacterium]
MEIADLVAILSASQLLIKQQGFYRLTRDGRQVATQDHRYGGAVLAKRMIEAGIFFTQARRLLESSSRDMTTGELNCPRARALEVAPQLTGVLRRFPNVRLLANLNVPSSLIDLLDDTWLSVNPAINRDRRKLLGNRGEEFSYRWQRGRALDRTLVRWVAQDDEGLGYDIEDGNETPRRRIEVKCTAADDVRFFLSANEAREAAINPESYEIQFWGGVRLEAPPLEEFNRLIRQGYPLIYLNPLDLVASGQLHMEPSVYQVTVPLCDCRSIHSML